MGSSCRTRALSLALVAVTAGTPAGWARTQQGASAKSAPSDVPGLVRWWRGDGDAEECRGTTVSRWHGTASYEEGVSGKALSFDGASYVEAGTAGLPTGDADRTLALWVKLDDVVAHQAFFAGYGRFGYRTESYHLGAIGSQLFFSQWGNSIGGVWLERDRWYFVAVTNTGEQVRLYRNGELVVSNAMSIATPAGTQFFIGKLPGGLGANQRSKGAIDDVTLYDRALSGEEIRMLYAARLAERPDLLAVPAPSLPAGALEDPDVRAQEAIESVWLEPNGRVAREIAGLQTHVYRAHVEAGTVLHAVVDQRGVDLLVTVFGPDGKHLLDHDGVNGPSGQEVVRHTARKTGMYRLAVRLLVPGNEAGRYEITLLEPTAARGEEPHAPPPAAEEVRAMAEAARLEAEAARLSDEGLYRRAVALQERAVALRERWSVVGWGNNAILRSLDALARLYVRAGAHDKAEGLAHRVAADIERRHIMYPEYAAPLRLLAGLYRARGEYTKARPLLLRAAELVEQLLGSEHIEVAGCVADLGELAWAEGDLRQATDLFARAEAIGERYIAFNLSSGSEQQKRTYMSHPVLARDVDRLVSLNARLGPTDPAVTRLALGAVLRRKGRVLDVLADSVGTLRRRGGLAERTMLGEWDEARSRLAELTFHVPGDGAPRDRPAEVSRLKARIEALEGQISARSARFRAPSAAVTVEGVREAIPEDAALVEVVRYAPRDLRQYDAWGAARYAAYVMTRHDEPRFVDLGDAVPIDAAASRFRRTLGGLDLSSAVAAARVLDELTLRPLREQFGQAHRLFVAPDGALNVVPFAALVDERSRFLVERYEIVNLTSGRDLLGLRNERSASGAPVIVANPEFGGVTASGGRRSIDVTRVRFRSLPATQREADEIARLMGGATVLSRALATEGALKRVEAPRVLHVATHGFFFEKAFSSRTDAGDRGDILDPLLRSGLVLAGANRREGGEGEDGILTALEAAGLDLWGTKLVVLSACDTGLGDLQAGDGVYGLRRALVLAGSETQIMSLWSVDDRVTRELMVGYYRELLSNSGRAEAMRRVQLRMLEDPKQRHPAHWAAFIVSGDWRPLR